MDVAGWRDGVRTFAPVGKTLAPPLVTNLQDPLTFQPLNWVTVTRVIALLTVNFPLPIRPCILGLMVRHQTN